MKDTARALKKMAAEARGATGKAPQLATLEITHRMEQTQ
jgi:hypothetical protein